MSEEKLKIGERVIIYNKLHKELGLGTVVKSKLEDVSHHGSPWYKNYLDVMSDNGKNYYGEMADEVGNPWMSSNYYLIPLSNYSSEVEALRRQVNDLEYENKKLRRKLDDIMQICEKE